MNAPIANQPVAILTSMSAPIRRQFCRTCLASCVPAVTVESDNGRLHWCATHAVDADAYLA